MKKLPITNKELFYKLKMVLVDFKRLIKKHKLRKYNLTNLDNWKEISSNDALILFSTTGNVEMVEHYMGDEKTHYKMGEPTQKEGIRIHIKDIEHHDKKRDFIYEK